MRRTGGPGAPPLVDTGATGTLGGPCIQGHRHVAGYRLASLAKIERMPSYRCPQWLYGCFRKNTVIDSMRAIGRVRNDVFDSCTSPGGHAAISIELLDLDRFCHSRILWQRRIGACRARNRCGRERVERADFSIVIFYGARRRSRSAMRHLSKQRLPRAGDLPGAGTTCGRVDRSAAIGRPLRADPAPGVWGHRRELMRSRRCASLPSAMPACAREPAMRPSGARSRCGE